MSLKQTTELYASVLHQLLPEGVHDSAQTTLVADDIYAHAKILAQADIDAHRLLKVLEAIPQELINEYETEYGLPLKCTVNASRTVEERLQILNWVRTSRNVLNLAYLEQLLAIFGVTLIDVVKFKPLLCTAACDSPVNTEQLRYKVLLRLQYPMNADMSCIIENYLPGYLRIEWMVDMPWGYWILNSSVTVNTNGIAYYTAYKTNQREYYDSYANLDLTAAIVRSLHDSDMQQWQAVKDAANELTGVTNWVIDPGNSQIVYTKPSDLNDPQDPEYGKYLYGMGFGEFPSPNKACQSFTTVHNIGFISANYDQCVTRQSLWGVMSDYAYAWSSLRTNPAYIPPSNGSLNGERLLTFAAIAQKIISNASSSDQAISLLAEAYIEAVANSIFNANESKQFVKRSDLLSQFELNKTLRT